MHGRSCRRGHLVTVQQRTLDRVDAEAMTESDDDAEMKNTNCIHVIVCVGILFVLIMSQRAHITLFDFLCTHNTSASILVSPCLGSSQ